MGRSEVEGVPGDGPWQTARQRYGPGVDVRRATADDVDDLVAVLARAFDDDPVSMYLFGRSRARRRGLRTFFRIQLRRLLAGAGEVWTTSTCTGAALWVPSGPPATAGWRDVVRLLPVAADLVAGGRPGPAVRLLADIERSRPTDPHWYLATIGTDPPSQGHGVGTALLSTVLRTVDAQGMPAYLESSKERNVPFYARHGFEVTSTLTSADGEVTLWLMWRAPQSVDAAGDGRGR